MSKVITDFTTVLTFSVDRGGITCSEKCLQPGSWYCLSNTRKSNLKPSSSTIKKWVKIPCNHSCDCLYDSYMALACSTVGIYRMQSFLNSLLYSLAFFFLWLFLWSLMLLNLHQFFVSLWRCSRFLRRFVVLYDLWTLPPLGALSCTNRLWIVIATHLKIFPDRVWFLFVSQSAISNHHMYIQSAKLKSIVIQYWFSRYWHQYWWSISISTALIVTSSWTISFVEYHIA